MVNNYLRIFLRTISLYSLKGENVNLEKEINVGLEENYLINGIIDKLEYDNDIIRVVDYKTGSAEQGLEELVLGRSYWRQAVFYTIDNFYIFNFRML